MSISKEPKTSKKVKKLLKPEQKIVELLVSRFFFVAFTIRVQVEKEEIKQEFEMETIKIKQSDLKLRNEMHFNIQRNTRVQIYKNKKKYDRNVEKRNYRRNYL